MMRPFSSQMSTSVSSESLRVLSMSLGILMTRLRPDCESFRLSVRAIVFTTLSLLFHHKFYIKVMCTECVMKIK